MSLKYVSAKGQQAAGATLDILINPPGPGRAGSASFESPWLGHLGSKSLCACDAIQILTYFKPNFSLASNCRVNVGYFRGHRNPSDLRQPNSLSNSPCPLGRARGRGRYNLLARAINNKPFQCNLNDGRNSSQRRHSAARVEQGNKKIFVSSPACAEGYEMPAQQREDSTTFMDNIQSNRL